MSNRINFIKWVGFITMFIDHLGAIVFPELLFLRVIGRIAFPCFLYSTVSGVLHTRNYERYAGRMLLMGIVSIFAWGRLFPLNIGFTLAIIIYGLTAYMKKDYKQFILFGVLCIFVEYGLYAYVLAFIIYLGQSKVWTMEETMRSYIVFHVLLAIVDPLQATAVFAGLLLPLAKKVDDLSIELPNISKAFGYSFYPVHVFLLRMLS